MIIKQDKDRYNNIILKFSPPLNNTRQDDRKALRFLYNHHYEYWSGIGWIGKQNDKTPALLNRLTEIYQEPIINLAA